MCIVRARDRGYDILGITTDASTKMNPAVYLAALLIDEGYADPVRRGYIRFLPKAAPRSRVGNIRFGFRLSADGKHVEPDPGEQGVLTEIRHLRQSGHTLRGIAAALNRQSLRTRRGIGGWSTWRES